MPVLGFHWAMSFKRKCETCCQLWVPAIGFCPADGSRLGPATLDRYEYVRSVAQSGMSEVFEARHIHTGKRVALKLLQSTLIKDEDMSERLRREAQATSAIGDPNIVDVTDFGSTADGGLYMVMEWIDGSTLRDVLEAGPVHPMIALDIVAQVAQGLAAAHLIGIVHRDVKPENIMIFSGPENSIRVKILDFGVAKLASKGQPRITRTGTIVGTPAYISPEQARGLPVDERADIYSLGCILYELTTDTQLFVSGSSMEMVMMHAMEVPERPCLRAPQKNIPEALDACIMRCLEKEKEDRFPSMASLKDILRKLQQGDVPQLETEEEEAANTFIFESRDIVRLQEVGRAARASSQPVYMPEEEVPIAGTNNWKATAILFGAIAVVATVTAVLLLQSDGGKATQEVASTAGGNDAGERVSNAIASLTPRKRSGDAQDAGSATVPSSDAAGVKTTDASPVANIWKHKREHSEFTITLSASPRPTLPQNPIALNFKLSDFKNKISWAVTEGRLRAEVQFVHFVSHDTLGSLAASVDDTGSFGYIFSVPHTGKYHLLLKFKDGSKTLGRTQMDICVGVDPDDADVESLCPDLNKFTGKHGAAR